MECIITTMHCHHDDHQTKRRVMNVKLWSESCQGNVSGLVGASAEPSFHKTQLTTFLIIIIIVIFIVIVITIVI